MSVGESSTPIGRVRGLGSAREGGAHWLSERLTSVALVLLGAWLVAALLFLPDLSRRTLLEWLARPSGAVPMALFVITAFRHGVDGLKVVVDDYVSSEENRWALNTLIRFLGVAGASLALFALGRIAFGAAA
jgi:succinate dehydrogenase / fumarate reductase, membrane anchor subunit